MKSVSDEDLVIAVLSAPSYAAAARDLGISAAAIAKRVKSEPICTMLRDRREAAFEAATTKLAELLSEAVETIAELMRSSTVQDSTRFAAAKAVLAHAAKSRELDLLSRRPTTEETWAVPVYTPARDERPGHGDPRKTENIAGTEDSIGAVS